MFSEVERLAVRKELCQDADISYKKTSQNHVQGLNPTRVVWVDMDT